MSAADQVACHDRILRLMSGGALNLENFKPHKRMMIGDYTPHPDEKPIDVAYTCITRCDREASGKAGLYTLMYNESFGLRWLDFADDFHDDSNAAWNALLECKETCSDLCCIMNKSQKHCWHIITVLLTAPPT